MDKINKALKKLTIKEKTTVKTMLIKINSHDFTGFDIKKLKGRQDIYRVRKGKIRIIYKIDNSKKISILTIERRNDNTYNE